MSSDGRESFVVTSPAIWSGKGVGTQTFNLSPAQGGSPQLTSNTLNRFAFAAATDSHGARRGFSA